VGVRRGVVVGLLVVVRGVVVVGRQVVVVAEDRQEEVVVAAVGRMVVVAAGVAGVAARISKGRCRVEGERSGFADTPPFRKLRERVGYRGVPLIMRYFFYAPKMFLSMNSLRNLPRGSCWLMRAW